MLMGEFQHAIDDKGRLFMPAKLRDSLGKVFYVCKGLDGCLFVYDKDHWKAFEEKLNSLPLAMKNARELKRFFFSGATEGVCDKQGRVLLPNNLRQHAGLEKEVIIVGVGDKVEIWNPDKWEADNKESAEELAEQLVDLGL